ADFDLRINDIRVRSGNVQTDAAEYSLRKTISLNPCPGLSGIRGFPNSRSRTAAVEAPRRSATLIRSSVQGLAVGLIDNEVGEARVFVDKLNVRPCLTTVARLINAPFFVRSEQVAYHRDVNDVRVFRINNDARNALRVGEAHLCEG